MAACYLYTDWASVCSISLLFLIVHTIDSDVIVRTAAITMSVPIDVCAKITCFRKLTYKPPLKGVMFTIRNGVVPILCPSVYCNGKID